MTRVRRRLVRGGIFAVLAPALIVALPTGASAAPIRQMQWYLDALQIPEAHQLTRGAGVVVAVIDNGVDASHRDLAGQVLPGADFGTAAGQDGRRDIDPAGHGTRMAGIIAAKGGAPDRALGIAPEAKILPVTIGLPNAAPATIVQAIHYAVDHQADVISISFGGAEGTSTYKRAETEAVKYALDHDVVVVSASGNTDNPVGPMLENDVNTPGDIPGVVCIAATTQDAQRLGTSIYGPEVVLAAPGEQIAGPVPVAIVPSGYAYGGQTSSATAIVAGVAALVRARYPDMDAKNVVNRLIQTARDQGNPGRDQYFGFGTVRPLKALTDNVPAVNAWPLPTPPGPTPSSQALPGQESSDSNSTLLLVGAGACLLVLVVLVIVVLVTVSSSRSPRRARQAAPLLAPTGVGPPGTGPPGSSAQPGGYPAPPGYPPPGSGPPPSYPAPPPR